MHGFSEGSRNFHFAASPPILSHLTVPLIRASAVLEVSAFYFVLEWILIAHAILTCLGDQNAIGENTEEREETWRSVDICSVILWMIPPHLGVMRTNVSVLDCLHKCRFNVILWSAGAVKIFSWGRLIYWAFNISFCGNFMIRVVVRLTASTAGNLWKLSVDVKVRIHFGLGCWFSWNL